MTEISTAPSEVTPFGVKLRPHSERRVPRKKKATKALSMSFLESNEPKFKEFYVKEFKDLQDFKPDSDANTLSTSRNKWFTSVKAQRTPREQKDNNNNDNNNNNNNISDNNNNSTSDGSLDNSSKRRSCTFASDFFYTGKNELNSISANAKPVLQRWASRSKVNIAKRNSDLGASSENISRSESTSNLLNQGLSNTPWGKYFKPRPLSTSSDISDFRRRDSSYVNLTTAKENNALNCSLANENIIKTNDTVTGRVENRITETTSPNAKNKNRKISQKNTINGCSELLNKQKGNKSSVEENKQKKVLKSDNSSLGTNSKNYDGNFIGKSISNESKNLIRIKSLDDFNIDNANEKIKSENLSLSFSTQNLPERKHSLTLYKQDQKTASVAQNKERKSRIKRSKSDLFKNEYVHIDFLQKPLKSDNHSNSSGEKPIEIIPKDNKNRKISVTGSNHRGRDINSTRKDSYTDEKEHLRKHQQFLIKKCDIDIDSESLLNKRTAAKSYTDVDDQISGVVSRKKSPQHSPRENTTILITNENKNIALARSKSEPSMKIYQQNCEEESKHDQKSAYNSNSVTDIKTNDVIIGDYCNIAMSNHVQRRFSATPGCYYDERNLNTTSPNLVGGSTKHNKNSLDNYRELISKEKHLANRSNSYDLSDFSVNGRIHKDIDVTRKSSWTSYDKNSTSFRSEKSLRDTVSTSYGNYHPKSAYLRKRLQEINNEKSNPSTDNTDRERLRTRPRSVTTNQGRYDPVEIDSFIKSYKDKQSNYNYQTPAKPLSSVNSGYEDLDSILVRSRSSSQDSTNYHLKKELPCKGQISPKESNISESEFQESHFDCNEMDNFFKRSASVRTSGSRFKRNDKSRLSENSLDGKKPFIRNAPSRSSERDRPLVSDNSESQTEPKHTTPSVFGSIKRVHVSKISGASELKSSAHFREKKKNESEDKRKSPTEQSAQNFQEDHVADDIGRNCNGEDDKGDSSIQSGGKHGGFSIFSLHKKKSQEPVSPQSPKLERHRKQSLSSYFSFKKDKNKNKDSPPTSPKLNKSKSVDQGDSLGETPLSPSHNKDRRGSGLLKLFHKKSHSPHGESSSSAIQVIEETSTENETSKANNEGKVANQKTEKSVKASSVIKTASTVQIRAKQPDENTKKKTVIRVTARRTQSDLTNSWGKSDRESSVRTQSLNEEPKSKSLNIKISNNMSKNEEELVKSEDFTHIEVESKKGLEHEIPDLLSPGDKLNVNNPAYVEKLNGHENKYVDGEAYLKCHSTANNNTDGELPSELVTTEKTLKNTPLSSLTVPGVNDMGSTDSLYDSDIGSKNRSRNKERIRNRKAARKEALERHKSLPAGFGDVEIDFSKANGVVEKPENENNNQAIAPNTTQAPKVRKKHKARRANTEFIMNVPLIDQEGSSMQSRDDGIVMRRNNKRNQRRADRPRTLTAGIDPDLIFNQREDIDVGEEKKSGVVNENLSFAEVKKKLLEGLTDDKKVPEKVSGKERQKIRRTKSTKRYKTITEGIAPRDLELAKQAMEAQHGENGTKNTIDKDTLEQITAALTSTNDKRKSFIVESRPASRYQSLENLHKSDENLNTKTDTAAVIPRPRALQRTKSMTTMHLQLDQDEDEDEIEIKPLSELKNRFLQAMEDTKQKHLNKKTPIEIKRRNKARSRKDRPHTICGLDDITMEQLKNEIGDTPENTFKKNQEEKQQVETKEKEETEINVAKPQKREKKKYQRATSQKLFDDLFDDIDDILDNGISESDLADVLGCNPSLHQDSTPVDFDVGNETTNTVTKQEETKEEVPKEVLPEKEIIPNGPQEPLSDLDFISSQTKQLASNIASNKRSLRPQRKHRSAVNPVKTLQQREDLIDETEVSNRPKAAENKGSLQRTDLAEEAISALRATVDFSKTKLRKVEVGKKASDVLAENFHPSEVTNLLLQVKGRKKCQTTVVEYKPESLNSNDCFVVVTPKDLICWTGAQSNVIERAKAAEVASRINQKKEMGCKASEVSYVDQGSSIDGRVLRALGGTASSTVDLKRTAINDEDFEKTMISAYMTYIVCEVNETPELIPLDSQCHRMPSKEILQTDSTFVFDFITEVYVWLGRQTGSQQRKLVQELAAEKFKEGYYKLILESNHLHAVHASHLGSSRKISITATTAHHRRGSKPHRRASIQQGRHQKREMVPRPDHSLLLQLYEGSEWVIFKEKFCDWPDESRIIRMKGGAGGEAKNVSTDINIEVIDVSSMVTVPPLFKMVLENVDVGRGRGIPKGMDGYHIITLDVKTWHVCDNNSILMPDASFGQFHSGEGYVIRWQYRVVKVRALRNCSDIMKAGGMERCCYFFWLGNDCTVNEEGATAVMTLELDSEKGPQIRVVLGKEPPALLNLFDGCMLIHAGKRPAQGVRDQFTDQSVIRLYSVRNEGESEACLLQVPAVCESLRSRSSFVLLLCSQGELFLWHGCRSNEGTRKAAEHAAQMLIQNHPEEASIGQKTEIFLTEVEEGEEPQVFWIALGGEEDYGSLLDDPSDASDLCPRLFHLESTTGTFLSYEVLCPSKTPTFNCPFPVLQDDMYNVEQPAIFLLDAVTHVYLWFGWWPDEDETDAIMSRRRRYDEERRKAMESAVLYAQEVGRPLESLYAVYAGLEPESFIELFPYWVVQDDITDLQLDEGIEEDKLYKITEELAIFTKDFYTIEELRAKPPPQGVDPTKLEKYLSEEDFLEVFHFHKETFYKLPVWQQTNWKKKAGLY